MNREMKQKHQIAAKIIFTRRNPVEILRQGRVDLHQLHLSEAKEVLIELLPSMKKAGVKKLFIATGSGHHSVVRTPKLLPFAIDFCQSIKLTTTLLSDSKGYTCGLSVNL